MEKVELDLSGLPESWDAIVVGAGAAGLYTALCLPHHWRVLLLTKDALRLSASGWAQGGIAAAIAPEDAVGLHVNDTLQAGAGLCEPQAVQFLVEEAADCIESLVDLGVAFDRQAGFLAMTREAAHSRPRVLHAADRTGKAVVTTLTAQVLERENIQVLSQAFVVQLWLNGEQGCQGLGVCQGDEIRWLRASAVILATGGGGQVFSHTTNPELSTGDGVALAHRAGALLRDLEFFQFHPTALMQPGAPCFLISEAVRGEGAHLIDNPGDSAGLGETNRFTLHYHPDGELAPRDVVSRAIFQHLQITGQQRVWLDLRPIPAAQLQYRFPNIIRVCQKWGIDPLSGPIPVAPAAHYWMGGIVTNTVGQTTVPGLYAVGETASTGVHGANRLASNSLLECIVFGRKLGQSLLTPSQSVPASEIRESLGRDVLGQPDVSEKRAVEVLAIADLDPSPHSPSQSSNSLTELSQTVATLRRSLAELLWTHAGICREQSVMAAGLVAIQALQAEFEALPLTQTLRAIAPGTDYHLGEPGASQLLRAWGELNNLLTIGQLILTSALFREESRGGHYRLDFPTTQEAWRVHTLVRGDRWFKSEPVTDGVDAKK